MFDVQEADDQRHLMEASLYASWQLQLVVEERHLDGVYGLGHPPCLVLGTRRSEPYLVLASSEEQQEAQSQEFIVVFSWVASVMDNFL